MSDVNWDEVLKSIEPEPPKFCPHTPYLKQKIFLKYEGLEALYGGRAGGGKSDALLMAALQYPLDVTTRVPTPSGWSTIGELQVGDWVFDETGNPCVITDKTGVSTLGERYRLNFSDGTSIVADGNHLWPAETSADRMSLGRGTSLPLRFVTTREMFATQKTDQRRKVVSNWSIRNAGPLNLEPIHLPIDPYILGAWLGDGSSENGLMAGIDPEIKEEFTKAGYTVTSETESHWYVPGLRSQLEQLGVRKKKHIPVAYLRSSKEQRLALLQGLMDTDGTVDNRWGQPKFSNTNIWLIDAAKDLIHSMGWQSQTFTEHYVTATNGLPGTIYHVTFLADEPVFRLPRKIQRQQQSIDRRRANTRSHKWRIVQSIELLTEQTPVQCLTVDSPNHMFLVGDSMIPTHNCHVPGYNAMIFRNSFADLSLPEAIMDRSHQWLDDQDGPKWIAKHGWWLFPSGARLGFGYLENPNDMYRYKGMEVQFIGFDEVTEIREKHYRYMFSRLRASNFSPALARVPLRVRAASNPAPNWVRRRFIENPVDENGHKRLYIPAGVEDNPYIGEEYLRSLAQLDPVERARLEKGDWYAEEEGSIFSRETFKIMNPEDVPEGAEQNLVRYWDTAATEPTASNPDPDWTAGALVSIHDGYIFVHDMVRFRANSAGVEARIAQTAWEDGVNVKVRMEQEGGASGKMAIDHYARHVLLGFDFDGHPALKKKVDRANLWAPKARRGEVILVAGRWIKSFLDEAIAFGAVEDAHDDQIDAVSGAFEFLTNLGQKKRSKVRIIV